jgi:hypothetical protein
VEQEPTLEYVVATYEEIRERFGLGGTDQARIKAKRRKWPLEPRNDPGALARVRVPQKEWDGAGQADRSPDQSRSFKALEGITTAFREERDRLVAERDAARVGEGMAREEAEKAREEAKVLAVRAAAAETDAKAQRERAERAERPFWRRWLG